MEINHWFEKKLTTIWFFRLVVSHGCAHHKFLENVLKIVTEVEFIPHYIDQPLFGDVCNYLEKFNLIKQNFYFRYLIIFIH